MLNAYSSFSGAQLVASFVAPTTPDPKPEPEPEPEPEPQPENTLVDACATQTPVSYVKLEDGQPICLKAKSSDNFYIYLRDNPAKVTIRTAGGNGNISLYASQATWANASNNQHSSVNSDNVETIEITNPGNGYLFIGTASDSGTDGVTMQLDIEQ